MAGERTDYYQNFTLTIDRCADAHGKLTVRATTVSGKRLTGESNLPLAEAVDYARELPVSGPGAPDDRAPRTLGAALAPKGPVRLALQQGLRTASDGGPGLRILLVCTDPGLAALPWELASLPSDAGDHEFLIRRPGASFVRKSAGPSVDPQEARGKAVVTSALSVNGSWHDDLGNELKLPALPPSAAGETTILAEDFTGPAFEVVRLADPLDWGALQEELSQPAWGFFFGGHGRHDGVFVADPDDPFRPRLLPVSELAAALTGAKVAVAILASCDSATAVTGQGHDEQWYNLAETLVQAGVPYVVGLRGPVKDRTAHDLTKWLFNGLAGYRCVDRALADARRRSADGWWQPVLHSSAAVDVRVVATTPRSRSSLEAWHLPADWMPGDRRAAPSDIHPARLDVLWGLDRGPFRSVVADVPDSDLAAALWSIEADILRKWTGRGTDPDTPKFRVPRRRWFTIPDRSVEHPLSTAAALERAVTEAVGLRSHLEEAGGRGVGLILACSEGGPRFSDPQRALADANDLISSWPEAAIIFHVVAPDISPAMKVAASLGRLLDDQGCVSATGTSVLTRVLPSAPRTTAAAQERPTLMARLRDLAPVQDGADAEVARELDTAAADPARFAELAHLLRMTRDDPAPLDDYQALLAYHARHGKFRVISLAAAAARDGDVATWLSASSGERPLLPTEVPAGLLTEEALDSIALGLLRHAGQVPERIRRALDPWRLHVSADVWQIVDRLRSDRPQRRTPQGRDDDDKQFLLDCETIAAAQKALRAGLGRRVTVRGLSPGGRPSPAAWVMLTRRQLNEETVELIASWPVPLRRILGFTQPGEDRAEADAETAARLAVVRQLLRPAHFPSLSVR